MKRKNLIIVIILLFAFQFFALAQTRSQRVRYVFDGDTILVDTGQKVRYLAIDAPEMGRDGKESEFMALEAREFNRQAVNQSKVILEFDLEKKDRHGRLLAYVFLEKGDMVNALLVREGLAHVLCKKPNVKYRLLLLRDQRLAMTERIGIWSRDNTKGEAYYAGNSASYRFHRPDCPFGNKIQPQHLVRFESRFAAFWEGYSPCKRCKP